MRGYWRGGRSAAATLAAALLSLAAVVGTAVPAGAQAYGPQPVGVTCTVVPTGPGLRIRCTVVGLGPRVRVTFVIFSTPRELGSVVTDGAGRAELDLALPADLAAGEHRVEARAAAVGGGAAEVVVSTLVDLGRLAGTGGGTGGAAKSGGLPRTGLPVAATTGAGSALVAVGLGLVLTARVAGGRRRRGRSVPDAERR